MADEFYTRPVLRVSDVSSSISYYCEKLGFERSWSFPDSQPIIAQVGRNGLDVILDSQSSIPRPSSPSVLAMTLHEAQNIGALYREFEARDANVGGVPAEALWEKGLFQFEVKDLEGNALVFWGEEPS